MFDTSPHPRTRTTPANENLADRTGGAQSSRIRPALVGSNPHAAMETSFRSSKSTCSPSPPSGLGTVLGGAHHARSDPWWRAERTTITSWIHAWAKPSHGTLTNPTSSSATRAVTHPRLCRVVRSSQFHSAASSSLVSGLGVELVDSSVRERAAPHDLDARRVGHRSNCSLRSSQSSSSRLRSCSTVVSSAPSSPMRS